MRTAEPEFVRSTVVMSVASDADMMKKTQSDGAHVTTYRPFIQQICENEPCSRTCSCSTRGNQISLSQSKFFCDHILRRNDTEISPPCLLIADGDTKSYRVIQISHEALDELDHIPVVFFAHRTGLIQQNEHVQRLRCIGHKNGMDQKL